MMKKVSGNSANAKSGGSSIVSSTLTLLSILSNSGKAPRRHRTREGLNEKDGVPETNVEASLGCGEVEPSDRDVSLPQLHLSDEDWFQTPFLNEIESEVYGCMDKMAPANDATTTVDVGAILSTQPGVEMISQASTPPRVSNSASPVPSSSSSSGSSSSKASSSAGGSAPASGTDFQYNREKRLVGKSISEGETAPESIAVGLGKGKGIFMSRMGDVEVTPLPSPKSTFAFSPSDSNADQKCAPRRSRLSLKRPIVEEEKARDLDNSEKSTPRRSRLSLKRPIVEEEKERDVDDIKKRTPKVGLDGNIFSQPDEKMVIEQFFTIYQQLGKDITALEERNPETEGLLNKARQDKLNVTMQIARLMRRDREIDEYIAKHEVEVEERKKELERKRAKMGEIKKLLNTE